MKRDGSERRGSDKVGGRKGGKEREKQLTQPAPVQVDGHEDRGDGEEVDHRVDLQPEPQLVVGCYKLTEGKGGGSGGGQDVRTTSELCCDATTMSPYSAAAAASSLLSLFFSADILYGMTKGFAPLAELCKWRAAKLLTTLFIHSTRQA